jgi:hypothetical protein
MHKKMEALTKAELYKQVYAERVPCPSCQRLLTRRTLRWRHHCKSHEPLSEEHAAVHKQMLVERAVAKLLHRMGKLDEIPTAGELHC